MSVLYGDGIHDDTLAIQEMINSGKCEVILPAPENFYLISKALVLPSNFRLVLPRFAEIRLAPDSNCFMVKNDTEYHPVFGMPAGVTDEKCFNIELVGGIWNCNNTEQLPNPQQVNNEDKSFVGFGMWFYNITNLKISSLTVKNPTNFGITIDTVSYFTVEDITFDYNRGNPMLINMDGIHANGNCHFGLIKNLKGTCYDDMVALNADEGTSGPIDNITVDGIYAENCHSAVRLLCIHEKLQNVHITNVYGTYYQYCIGVTRFAPEDADGYYDSLTFDNIYASKAVRPADYPWPDHYIYPLIWVESGLTVKNLYIGHLYRKEYNNPIDTIYVGKNTVIKNLSLENISMENHTGKDIVMFKNEGNIEKLYIENVSPCITVNAGTVAEKANN